MISPDDVKQPIYLQYIIGGLSGSIVNSLVYPQDTLKTRIQISKPGEYTSSLDAFRKIVKTNGVLSLYTGLSASVARQLTYGATRFGTHANLTEAYTNYYAQPPPLGVSMLISLFAGGLGALLGVPAELVMVRMQLNHAMPRDERRNYTGLFNGISRIVREEGFTTLWRGCGESVLRICVLNVTQLTSYGHIKRYLLAHGVPDGPQIVVPSSFGAGFLMCIVSLPFDMAKTKIQNMKSMPRGEKQVRSNSITIIMETIRIEGLKSLWKGFGAYYMRFGPSSMLLFLVLEQFNKQYKIYVATK